MRALQHYGIFVEVEEEVYEHNALSTRLSTPPISQSAMPMYVCLSIKLKRYPGLT